MSYKLRAGLETHIELSTKTKIFCSCEVKFGDAPNTHCCEVCTGMPGALPTLNKKVVEYGVLAGMALGCEIEKCSKMDRKNYFYPDLPKAYQISQFDMPLCRNGFLTLSSGRKIRIERIHIEEDAGKLIRRGDEVLIDYNRAGVPLIEIVTKPDFESSDEVREYLEKLQILMRYIGISDCRMQEGSLRCDVNISLCDEEKGEAFERTEIKNMNSIGNIVKAMEFEYERQKKLLERGEKIERLTLRYNDATGETEMMRSKESSADYRYFPEPDLGYIVLSDEETEALKRSLPELPFNKAKRYKEELFLSLNDAENLTSYRRVSEFFDEASAGAVEAAIVAKLITGTIFSTLKTEKDKEKFEILTTPLELKKLSDLVAKGMINISLAKTTLLKMLSTGKPVSEFIKSEDLVALTEEELKSLCEDAVMSNTGARNDFLSGKDKAIMVLVGYVMRKSQGKANAKKTEEMLRAILREND